MNKLLSLSVLATTLLLSSCSNTPQEEPLAKVIDRGLKASTEQALLMAKELEQQEGRLPKSIKDGKLETSDCYWWCSGFFPGELWYLYESNPTPELKKYAELFTGRLEKVQHVTGNHDVGFMLYCSYGDQDTAAHHKGEHMGYTVHELGINLVSYAAAALCLRTLLHCAGSVIYRGISIYGSLKQSVCLADSV